MNVLFEGKRLKWVCQDCLAVWSDGACMGLDAETLEPVCPDCGGEVCGCPVCLQDALVALGRGMWLPGEDGVQRSAEPSEARCDSFLGLSQLAGDRDE